MSELEIFTMNATGAGWVPLSLSDKVSLEVDLMTGAKVTLSCLVCSVPVPEGRGHSYCDKHTPNNPSCGSCGCVQMGLYCSHCFTGRIGTTPTGERYHIPYEVPRCK